MSQQDRPTIAAQNPAAHYKRLLAGRALSGGAEGPFESAGAAAPDLSDGGIADRVGAGRGELSRIVKDHLGDTPELHEIVEQIAREAKTALRAVADENNAALANPATLSALEVIVRTDGSRPSFMVRNGAPDRTTSPVGDWTATLDDSAALLAQAVQCVGRIDDPSGAQGFQGTGILIGDNLVMTNRHVLQAIASSQPDRSWKLNPDIAIDFGHEFRAVASAGRRKITAVLFAGVTPINPIAIDHAKLDLALLALEPAAAGAKPPTLALDISPDWGQAQSGIFICGFPGNPGFSEAPSLLETLFKSTYGCKRLAPGLVTTTAAAMGASPRHWTLGHDATTLGGNSGSSVLVIGREQAVAGLHYGGRRSDPRENWCHVLGLALDEPGGIGGKSLRDILSQEGVRLIDRLPS
jgi:hypothetical protein